MNILLGRVYSKHATEQFSSDGDNLTLARFTEKIEEPVTEGEAWENE